MHLARSLDRAVNHGFRVELVLAVDKLVFRGGPVGAPGDDERVPGMVGKPDVRYFQSLSLSPGLKRAGKKERDALVFMLAGIVLSAVFGPFPFTSSLFEQGQQSQQVKDVYRAAGVHVSRAEKLLIIRHELAAQDFQQFQQIENIYRPVAVQVAFYHLVRVVNRDTDRTEILREKDPKMLGR